MPEGTIEVAGIKEALKQGPTGIRDYLTLRPPADMQKPTERQRYNREEVLARSKTMLNLVRTDEDLKKLSNGEKLKIINDAKAAVEGLHTEVTNDLRTKADTKMEDLKKRIEEVRTSAVSHEKELSGPLDKVSIVSRETVRAVSNADAATKLKYGAIIGAAVLAGVWLWKKTKSGASKTRNWLLWGLAGVAGIFGLMAFKKQIGEYLDKHGAGKLADGLRAGYKGVDSGLTGVGNGVKESAENADTLMDGLKKGEVWTVVKGGVAYFFNSAGSLVGKIPEEVALAWKGQWFDLIRVHAEGMAIYGASFGVVQTAINTIKSGGNVRGALGKTLLSATTWEFEVVRGLVKTTTKTVGAAVNVRGAYVNGKLVWKTRLGSTDLSHMYDIVDRWKQVKDGVTKGKMPSSALVAHEENLKKVLMGMQKELGTTVPHPDIERIFGKNVADQVVHAVEANKTRYASSIRYSKDTNIISALDEKVIKNVTRPLQGAADAATATADTAKATADAAKAAPKAAATAAPDAVAQAAKEAENATANTKALKDAKASAAEIAEAERAEQAARAKLATAKANPVKPTTPTKPASAPSAAPAKGAAAGTEAVGKGAEAAGMERKLLEIMKSKLGPDKAAECMRMFQQNGLNDPKTLRLFTDSPRSQKILASAMAAAEPAAEMERVLRAAKTARNWRIGFGAVGVTGDIFGVVIAISDIVNNGGRIEDARKTNNEELAALYQSAYPVYAAELGSSLAGLGIAGYSVYAAGGLMAGLSAPIMVTFAPISLAVVAGAYGNKKLSEGAEYMLKNDKDLLNHSSGSILEHVGKSKQDSSINWVMGVQSSLDWTRDYNTADQMARVTGYQAYFRQMSLGVLPPATMLDVREANEEARKEQQRMRDAGQETGADYKETPERLKMVQEQRTANFVMDAMKYTNHVTDTKYELVTPEQLRNAELFAAMCFQKRSRGETVNVPWDTKSNKYESQWQELAGELRVAKQEQEKAFGEEVSELSKDKQQFAEKAPAIFLQNLHHDLADCERKILTTDFSNLGSISGWTQWRGDDEMREISRGAMADKLRGILASAMNNGRELTPPEASALLEKMRNELNTFKPDETALQIMNGSKSPAAYANAGRNPVLLSEAGMMGYLQVESLPTGSPDAKEKPEDVQKRGETYLNGALGPKADGRDYWELSTGLSFNLNPMFSFQNGRWCARWKKSDAWQDPATTIPPAGKGREQAQAVLDKLRELNSKL